ncbi:MAG TPA: thiazolylpeptide-type bacteriocin [Ktedonobacteraceae bacterium]|nr:thiazolylpeptide-type bacteriocin [Ktedonobacteraceae bacterium]
MESQFEFEIQSKFSMQEELRSLDVETFEIEDLADLGQEAALAPGGGCTSCCSSCCSSCSTSSCSCCSTSCSSS